MSAEAYLDTILSIWAERGATSTCKISGLSMAPLLKPGDSLLIRHGVGKIRIGDVIVFKASEKLLVHRVVSRRKTREGEVLLAKGDRSRVFDEPIVPGQVIGKVLEAQGPSGRLRLTSRSWRLTNFCLAALSRRAASSDRAGRALWTLVRLIRLVRSRQLAGAISHRFRTKASRDTRSHRA